MVCGEVNVYNNMLLWCVERSMYYDSGNDVYSFITHWLSWVVETPFEGVRKRWLLSLKVG